MTHYFNRYFGTWQVLFFVFVAFSWPTAHSNLTQTGLTLNSGVHSSFSMLTKKHVFSRRSSDPKNLVEPSSQKELAVLSAETQNTPRSYAMNQAPIPSTTAYQPTRFLVLRI